MSDNGIQENLFGDNRASDLFGTSTGDSEEDSTSDGEVVTETLPALDYGYFDALVAIGYAALADAYYETPGSPRIERRPTGFQVSFVPHPLDSPHLVWLKYSVAKSWKEKDWYRDGWTLVKDADFITDKEAGARRSYEALISTEGAAIDTSEDDTATVEVEGQTYDITDPIQRLYAALNKYADPTWINLCVYACRHEYEALLDGSFEEEKITFNSAVLPQSSKGANSGNAYSIRNTSLSKSTSRPLSRRTCLAVAGLLRVGAGDANTGFVVPVPQQIEVEKIDQIVQDNRRRPMGGGFFFAFDNYLSYLKLLLTYAGEDMDEEEARNALSSIAGANFVELGNAPSPSGSWQFTVPNHRFTNRSVERLQTLLYRWKKASTPPRGGTPSVDRASVRQLVRGFEESEPLDAAEGYLSYITSVGVKRREDGQNRTYYRLDQSFFDEIMAHDSTYSELLDAFQEEEVAEFVKLVRQDTHNAVYHDPDEPDRTPDYEMIRKLREVQGMDDFVQAIAEISIERGVTKIATANSEESEAEYHSRPYEPSVRRLTELAEEYSARLVAQLVLSFALSRTPRNSDGD